MLRFVLFKMLNYRLTRRTFLAATGALAAPAHALSSGKLNTGNPSKVDANKELDSYIALYMREMNAPGMIVGLTDSTKTVRTAGYGLANVEQNLPVSADHLFQIGSISKSFVAIALLQLVDEGRLDLNRPVIDLLPWLPIVTEYGPVTTHHLLTHTSGLPDSLGLFLSDSGARHFQSFKPGEHFHYSNLGFDLLGHIVAKLDGRPWREAIRARILTPLDMKDTVGVITTASRSRSATGYQPYRDDEVYPRHGKLAPSPNLVFDDAAGCVLSSAGDMARYLRMLLNRGQGPNGRIVSESSFSLLSKPYIKAPEFSPTAFYGYGIAVDKLDGQTILRHTGGMISFASSIHVNLDSGVAAFASINAMQGYRPTAVTQYAVRLLRAEREAKPLPSPEPLKDPLDVENASNYAGTFVGAKGAKLVFVADGKRLSLIQDGVSIPLEQSGGDVFMSTISGQFAKFPLTFGRTGGESKQSPVSATSPVKPDSKVEDSAKPKQKPRITEVNYGPAWYTNESYSGAREFPVSEAYRAFAGQYQSDSAWIGSVSVFILKGRLTLGGTTLTPIGNALFRIGDESWTPDTAEFLQVVEGKARMLKLTGADCWRVEVE